MIVLKSLYTQLPAWAGLVVIILLATLLSSVRLNDALIWSDEQITLDQVGGGPYGPIGFDTLLQRVAGQNSWPPLYYAFMWGWGKIAGWSEFALRAPSLLFGVLAIAVTYRLACMMVSRRVGILAALLLGTSAFLSHYMHDGRGYTLYAFFTALAVWGYWLVSVKQKWGIGYICLFVLSLAGLIYTHYLGITTAAFIGVYHLFFVKKNHRWWQVTGFAIFSGVSFLPWLWAAVQAVQVELEHDRGIHPLALINGGFYGFSNGMAVFLLVILLHIILRVRNSHTGLMGLWIVMIIVVATIFNLWADFLFHVRHLIGLLVPLVILLALGIADLQRLFRPLGIILPAIWVGGGMWNSLTPAFMENSSMPNQVQSIPRSFLMTVEATAGCMSRGAPMVFYASPPFWEWSYYRSFNYYLENTDLKYTQLTEMRLPGKPAELSRPYDLRVNDFVDDAPTVWLFVLDTLPLVPEYEQFEQILSTRYTACEPIFDGDKTHIFTFTKNNSAVVCSMLACDFTSP